MDHPSPPFCTTNYQNMVKSNLCCYYFCFQVFFQKYAFLKVKDFGMSQYSETLCAMCSILTLISCDWGYIFQDFGYTIDAKPVKNVNENVTHI